MKWSSTVSTEPGLEDAVAEAVSRVLQTLGQPPDLAAVFVSEHHRDRYDRLPGELATSLRARVLVGCSAGGRDRRRTGGGGGARLVAHARRFCRALRSPASTSRMSKSSPGPHGEGLATLGDAPDFVLLADPFTFDVETLRPRPRRAISRQHEGRWAGQRRTPAERERALPERRRVPRRMRGRGALRATSASTRSSRRAAGRSASRCS